ncbi:peptidoglycan amidohydrolase family protein [Estrella lausannensis]|uniref:Putative lipoprotein n=1 Tax=Estrella lausannensis TaxID=483423 RepID=A0A0H5DNW0_9BACT|nr:peptidoglycan amidohydrolase family protein [Estrella lausannensis]CRX38007.1 Putative lipoprotein [Estrella lausannensis]
MQAIVDLQASASYKRQAFVEEAPSFADCLTSIHYIFKRALGFDLSVTFIGDMPRQLFSYSRLRYLKADSTTLQLGDILFVSSKKSKRMITHVALAVDKERVFHCSYDSGCAEVESLSTFFSKYEQRLTPQEMLRYIDYRNTALRAEQGGAFIKDSRQSLS